MPDRPFAISVLVSPAKPGDNVALQTLVRELAQDPTVGFESRDSGIALYGDTECDMEQFFIRLRDAAPFPLSAGAPAVQYRETLMHSVVTDHSHRSSIEGRDAVASVKLAFAPRERGTGFIFSSQTELREDLAASVEHVIAQEKEEGLLYGFPLIDFHASLIEATYREAGANEEMFAQATRAAFRKLAPSGAIWLMEPVLLVRVPVLDEFADAAIADLIERCGKILDVEDTDTAKRIRALVPASNMFGYINVIMPLARERARYDAVFDHYAPVPAERRA
ncbi:MAG TPA: hypothetical protein VGG10_16710 [Rhizomicrobium sp.]|jgi:elongation factor G